MNYDAGGIQAGLPSSRHCHAIMTQLKKKVVTPQLGGKEGINYDVGNTGS